MTRLNKFAALILTAAMLLTLAGCFVSASSNDAKVKDSETASYVDLPISQGSDPTRIIKNTYDFNKGRTYAVAVVKDKSEGSYAIGTCADGFTMQGKRAHLLDCEVLYYFNYDRLKEAAENDDPNATYCYFKIDGFGYGGSKARTEELKDRPGGETIFDGNITEEFVENLKKRGKSITYSIYLDMEHGDAVEVGDTILVAIDPQLTINPNYVTGAYEIKDPKSYYAVAAPFADDSPQPYIAKFIDGRLQLSGKPQGAFALKRLYDVPDPQLTGIKDGDSIETVVAFLKAVEQDMARYQAEHTQEVAAEPVSPKTESSEPVVQESSGGLRSALGGYAGHYSVAISDSIYYRSDDLVSIDTGTNTRQLLDGADINSREEMLLRDANGDCLLSMEFSLEEGFIIYRMELDGSGKREIIRLPGYMLTYLDREYIQTVGSKLYVMLRNAKEDIYELIEIDVDAETATSVYVFEVGQTVLGGYGNSIFLRTEQGKAFQEKSMFDPVFRYRFDAYNIETGMVTEITEAVVSSIRYYSSHNFLFVTLENEKLVTHIYDLAAGTETQTVLDVVPESFMYDPNTGTIDVRKVGDVLDGTHFMLNYCIVDAENGTAVSLDDVYADAAVKVPSDAMMFAETDTTFYLKSFMGSDEIYVVPREQLLGGYVTDVTILQ